MRRTHYQRDRKLSYTSHFCQNHLTLTLASAGGVSVIGGGGRIEINNTLEERLKMCETDALPVVRVILFGKNENRKFDN